MPADIRQIKWRARLYLREAMHLAVVARELAELRKHPVRWAGFGGEVQAVNARAAELFFRWSRRTDLLFLRSLPRAVEMELA